MLELRNVVKNYEMGDTTVEALKGISIEFRENEFVSVLGQSGCGKTTLLNIIGGLDGYTDGDLIINGVSTKQYKAGDWDSYRNHKIGFVFQSYNLIPHQNVLSNVELALTLSGVSKTERRKCAVEALEKVGLGDQLKKKPNQMSGGQMQRVAIARALVNNPDILLADEPTGALDSETSVQIMELLKEISKEKLVIMVTHNPDLAEQYSTRTVKLLDGRIVSDSAPYHSEEADSSAGEKSSEKHKKTQAEKKPSMSFFTALSLSLNNLMTKKTRTFLTSFAGSIGIIGIALILAISNGIQGYIDSVQQDTLASYPISINAEDVDLSSVISTFAGSKNSEVDHELDAVYSNETMYEMFNSLTNADTKTNNLEAFKKYLDSKREEQSKYVSAVQYGYSLTPSVYTKDTDGKIVKSDIMELLTQMMGSNSMYSNFSSYSSSGFKVWQEMLDGQDGAIVNGILTEQYDVINGSWPESANEIVLIVDENNEITDMSLYALGLVTSDEMAKIMTAAQSGETIDTTQHRYSFDELCGMTFKYVIPSDCYQYDDQTGTYIDLSETESGMNYLYDNGYELKISGIIRPNPDASSAMLSGSIGYTSALTDYVVEQANNSDIVKKQLGSADKNIITGQKFETDDSEIPESEKAAEFAAYVSALNDVKKAALYTDIMSTPADEYISAAIAQYKTSMTREEMEETIIAEYVAQTGMEEEKVREYISGLDDETFDSYIDKAISESISSQYAEGVSAQLSAMTNEQMAMALDSLIAAADEKTLAGYRDSFMDSEYSETNLEETLSLLGYVNLDKPTSINIYASTFENKDKIGQMIEDYNSGVAEDDKISYTDYVKLLMSSITTIINAISYVLIAFVAISLVVSSIMIGIITYISVLERTKEIGILRAIGASKKDVSRLFNAETVIVGLTSGIIGIGLTVLLCLPINALIHSLTGIAAINARLPVAAGVILVLISVLLTVVAGLVPARIAAKKDPVEALRTE